MFRLQISLLICATSALYAQNKTDLAVAGLSQPVEVVRDNFGINHIYAKNEHDLFFAQGYCAARDRLFQFEMWRRQATGTMAEILGAKEVKRDIGSRLFQFRGNLKQEFNHYHPRGEAIITAFTEGINAYVGQIMKDPKQLPLEFRLLGITPGYWTPEVVISRHQGLLGNLSEELLTTRAVAAIGPDKVKDLNIFEPGQVDLTLDPSVNKDGLADNITELYDAFRKPLVFSPQDLRTASNKNFDEFKFLAAQDESDYNELRVGEKQVIGSNNWVVSGKFSNSGFPLLANDPHRDLLIPSIRYMVHLNAPGWNVVGGGEATVPGVSIGHNDFGAWGLTVFMLDAEDLYVYELNPENKNQYKYLDRWEDMRSIKDTIRVKNSSPVYVEHKYTRHGPVTLVDSKNNRAYAVRCGWLEQGGAPYLASLRIDQSTNWDEFREGCSYSNIPGENMIWADRNGNIGWQAVGIAPVRKNWSGLVAVPGDGRYEWDGYLPIKSLPYVFNPSQGFWVTANDNLVPKDYAHTNAVGKVWADKFRADRIEEVLRSGTKHTLEDMMQLQFDYLSNPARLLVPFLKEVKSDNLKTESARNRLLNWNYVLDKNSVEAGIYVAWRKAISRNAVQLFVPDKGKPFIKTITMKKIIDWITEPRPEFGDNPVEGRNQFLISCFQQAIDSLTVKLGPEMSKWQYGQTAYHRALIKHPLSNAVDPATRKKLDVGPVPRGGYGLTVGVTGTMDNQMIGASFRMAVDLKDWDQCMFTNTPGQSGDPDSPFYKNLFELWANDRHFPVYFSRKKIESNAVEKLNLGPL